MIQVILLNSHVIIVESKDISRLNVLMLTKRRRRLMTGKRRKRPRKDVPTKLGRTMMIQQALHLKKKVRKQIYASWPDMNHRHQAK